MKLNLKMVQDQRLQPKNKVLFGLLLKNCYSVGAMNLWWGESTGGILASEGDFPPSPNR